MIHQNSEENNGSTQPSPNSNTRNNSANGGNTDIVWYDKYIERIIGMAITAFLFGITGWAFSYFASKIQHIEKTIAAHHGPEWEKIEKVVAIGKLRKEFLDAKEEYKARLHSLSDRLDHQNTIIQKVTTKNEASIEALKKWDNQWDQRRNQWLGRQYVAYALLTNRAQPNENVAVLNTAHVAGTRFARGDKVSVTNTSSGHDETVVVEITSAYTDLDKTDVLLQLGQQPANIIGLSEQLGKIKVIIKKEVSQQDDPNRLKTITEFLGTSQL